MCFERSTPPSSLYSLLLNASTGPVQTLVFFEFFISFSGLEMNETHLILFYTDTDSGRRE